METLVVPSWIWVNLIVLVAAVIFVRIKLGSGNRRAAQADRKASGAISRRA